MKDIYEYVMDEARYVLSLSVSLKKFEASQILKKSKLCSFVFCLFASSVSI